MNEFTSQNEKTWDLVADQFIDACALPVWGPFGVGDDLNLLPEITGKTFLEVGCGSGRSIKYLINKGAQKVYGIDISSVQLQEAASFNEQEIAQGKVELIKSPMEEKIDVEPVDVVCSVYALGWTHDPEATLNNIYSYLKPGGIFIWSWDHKFFKDVKYRDGKLVVDYSYHEESTVPHENWRKSNSSVHIVYRKTSSWFQLLRNAGFDVIGYHEPKPKTMDRGSEDPERYYSIQKAEQIPCTFIFVCRKPF